MHGKNLHPQKNILEGIAPCLRQQGKGKTSELCSELDSRRGKSIELGDSSPRSLIQTVWWYNCLHFLYEREARTL